MLEISPEVALRFQDVLLDGSQTELQLAGGGSASPEDRESLSFYWECDAPFDALCLAESQSSDPPESVLIPYGYYLDCK